MASRNAQLMAPGLYTESDKLPFMYANEYVILTFADTIDLSIGTGFFIPASGEHGDRLPLVFPFVGEVVGYDTSQLPIVSQTAQK